MESSKYNEIARAAVHLFNKKGYHATSMQDIADYVGLQKGSLYHHISSKEELLLQITSRSIGGFVRDLEKIVELEQPAKVKLEKAIHMHFNRVTEDIQMTTILLRESFLLSDDPHQIIKNSTDHYLNLWSQIIREGMNNGEFKEGHPRLAALSILGACNWAYRWYQEDGSMGNDELAAYITSLWIGGLDNN